MSKPWDNEPTPFKDRLVDEHGDFFISQTAVENIERRLRHAERLLELSVKTHGIGFVTGKMEKHLEAARQEDA